MTSLWFEFSEYVHSSYDADPATLDRSRGIVTPASSHIQSSNGVTIIALEEEPMDWALSVQTGLSKLSLDPD